MSEPLFVRPPTFMDIRYNQGCFIIDRHVLESLTLNQLEALFGKVVVLRCEMDYARDAFRYIGASKHFEKISEGMLAPEYYVEVEHGEGGQIKRIEFKRLDGYTSSALSDEPETADEAGLFS